MTGTGGAGGVVLVVDDDPQLRHLFADALEHAGLSTRQAGDGQSALDELAAGDVAALVIDSSMPVMGGLDVIRSLRADPATATLPVIMVTGQADLGARLDGLEAGADDYLPKPVHLRELVARVQAQLRGQAAWIRLFEGKLRERAALTESLCRLRPRSRPEDTAAQVCRELCRLADLRSAAVIGFAADGGATALARAGTGTDGDERGLPSSVAMALFERAANGPWMERPPGHHAASVLGDSIPNAAFAPLLGKGRLLGVLGIGAASVGRTLDDAGHHLSTAIDVATIAAALLAPALDGVAHEDERARLEAVLAGRSFHPVFQPVVDLRTGRVEGYEALTRFDDGVLPGVRFAEAGRLGMGHALERATLTAALDAAAVLERDAWLSVNVSATFLVGDGVEGVLDVTDRPLVIELTEHERIDDYGAVREAVERIRPAVHLSVDDAGAGFASLGHILALRPSFVKLDQSWLRTIEVDPARQALVAGLGHFAARTGCRLVAEGIETEEELAVVRELGVHLGQGYLLGRPAPVAWAKEA